MLLRLMAMHVIPCAVATRLHRRDAGAVAAAQVSLASQGNQCTITARGAWEDGNLAPLRAAFDLATQAPSHVRVDFSAVTHIDSACIALLMLLYGHQSKIGLRFELCDVQPAVQRLLRLFCADYLVGSGQDSRQDKPVSMSMQ